MVVGVRVGARGAAVLRCAAAAGLVVAVCAGCSLFDREEEVDQGRSPAREGAARGAWQAGAVKLWGRKERVTLEVDDGFHVAEAPALQRAIVQVLGADKTGGVPVPAELQLEPGRGDALVVVWRNMIVGFVPPERAGGLAARLPRGRAVGVVPGCVHPEVHDVPRDGDDRHGVLWRIWAGPVPEVFPEVPEGLDRLAVPERTILGIPLSRIHTPPPH